MTELKTLKDFELHELLDSPEFKIISSVSKAVIIKGEIRNLAIKWVKDIDENLKEFEGYQGEIVKNEVADRIQGFIATREWIKHFFNITEEDLK